jgi:hypothetical protein
MTAMIGIVGCGSQKLDRPAPARELYTSQLFRKSLAYAEQHCEVVYIASALHGLVELDRVLAPYDATHASGNGSKKDRQRWGSQIGGRLVDRHGDDAHYIILAGEAYATPIRGHLETYKGFRDGPGATKWRGVASVLEPLKGMQVGERLAFLTAQIRRAA